MPSALRPYISSHDRTKSKQNIGYGFSVGFSRENSVCIGRVSRDRKTEVEKTSVKCYAVICY